MGQPHSQALTRQVPPALHSASCPSTTTTAPTDPLTRRTTPWTTTQKREPGVPRDADVGQRALYCEERIQSRRTKRPPYLERCNLWPRRVHRPDARNTNAVRRLRCALLGAARQRSARGGARRSPAHEGLRLMVPGCTEGLDSLQTSRAAAPALRSAAALESPARVVQLC